MQSCFKPNTTFSFPSLKSRMIKFLYSKVHSENWTLYPVEVVIINWSMYSKSLWAGFGRVSTIFYLSPRSNVRNGLPGNIFINSIFYGPKCLLEKMDEYLNEYFRNWMNLDCHAFVWKWGSEYIHPPTYSTTTTKMMRLLSKKWINL